tara:strand:+ start:891 stop:1301 length:411 start_codon:yes stop_codon:yes gene_type:complete
MLKFFFPYLKILFYIANIVLITLYVFPGSILGWFFFDNVGKQPQITSDFIVSSNHVYAFMILSFLGYISFEKRKLTFLFIYLFLISIFLEILHTIIPNRGFEFSDLFGNIIGVLIVYFFYQTYNYFYNSKNENKKF